MNFEKKFKNFTQTLQDKSTSISLQLVDHICTVPKTQIVIQQCRLLILFSMIYIYQFSLEQDTF